MVVALAGIPAVFWEPLYDDFTLPKQAVLLVAGSVAAAAFGWGGWWRTVPSWLLALGAGWVVVVVASAALGLDWRGSVLGYYQYRQGLVTQLAYLGLFAGGWALAVQGAWRVFLGGLVGMAAALVYTAIQAAGADPFTWWIDTSERAFGTIGNANELSAFAVVAMGLTAFLPRRWFVPGAALVWGAALFMVLEAESRSGLVAVGLFLALLPLARRVARAPSAPLWRAMPAVVISLGAVTAASLFAGGLEGTAARVTGEATVAEHGGSTRIALWRGTLDVIAERPILGTGPDGLHLGFPRWRPANLGGAYREYDLVAQSSHNSLLDIAATTGLSGLLVLGSLVVCTSVASVRSFRRSGGGSGPDWSIAWAALAAYGALTLVNPISLAAHAVFFSLLGAMAGDALARRGHERRSFGGLAVGGLVTAGALPIAVMLPLADVRAQAGWEAFASGRFASAAQEYRAAGRMIPFERDYARREAVALVAAASEDMERLPEAEQALRRFDRRFGFAAGDAFNLAAVLVGEERPEAEVKSAVARAVRLNPHGYATAAYAATVMRAAHLGGVLVFDGEDRWTYVVPLPDLPDDGNR